MLIYYTNFTTKTLLPSRALQWKQTYAIENVCKRKVGGRRTYTYQLTPESLSERVIDSQRVIGSPCVAACYQIRAHFLFLNAMYVWPY